MDKVEEFAVRLRAIKVFPRPTIKGIGKNDIILRRLKFSILILFFVALKTVVCGNSHRPQLLEYANPASVCLCPNHHVLFDAGGSP